MLLLSGNQHNYYVDFSIINNNHNTCVVSGVPILPAFLTISNHWFKYSLNVCVNILKATNLIIHVFTFTASHLYIHGSRNSVIICSFCSVLRCGSILPREQYLFVCLFVYLLLIKIGYTCSIKYMLYTCIYVIL